ncbi:phosphotransferase [Desmospora activa]|uniref:CotS family spore coat protein n=1 Tax=Desmospora activa DSM 45169 TaxID=1121389 RepID=A0A2T4Z0F2_9BACL|nr:phosphotransferase [Desmospora activa]PTM53200.1 CotS family spore coat protein [Desmospora activa DSM 45169]
MFRVKADVTIDQKKIKAIITRDYDLEVIALERVRAVYKVYTDKGTYGFKNAEELPDLPFIADCLQQIKKNGFNRIPHLLFSKQGELLVHEDGESYFMEHWLKLRELPSHSLPHFTEIGSALAHFHEASCGISKPDSNNPRSQWGTHHSFLIKSKKLLDRWQQDDRYKDDTETWLLRFLRYRCEMALHFIQTAPQDAQYGVWCHNALQHRNLMLDDSNEVWLIDFETLAYRERVWDLAHFLEYHARPLDWHPHACQLFLNTYQVSVKTPIQQQEWNLFFSYLAFPKRLYRRMKRYFGVNNPGSSQLNRFVKTVKREMTKEPCFQTLYTHLVQSE